MTDEQIAKWEATRKKRADADRKKRELLNKPKEDNTELIKKVEANNSGEKVKRISKEFKIGNKSYAVATFSSNTPKNEFYDGIVHGLDGKIPQWVVNSQLREHKEYDGIHNLRKIGETEKAHKMEMYGWDKYGMDRHHHFFIGKSLIK